MNSALPLVKDVNFGGGSQSLRVISGLILTVTAKQQKLQEGGSSVFLAIMLS